MESRVLGLCFLSVLFLLTGSFITYGQEKNHFDNMGRIDIFTNSHIFKAGDKIRLVIANLGTAPRDTLFLLTIPPSVLPVFVDCDNGNFLSPNSCVELPVIIASGSCRTFAPGNPVTTVEYSVSASGKVELKAFDLSGREVKILVDENHRNISHCPKLKAVILHAVFIPAR